MNEEKSDSLSDIYYLLTEVEEHMPTAGQVKDMFIYLNNILIYIQVFGCLITFLLIVIAVKLLFF